MKKREKKAFWSKVRGYLLSGVATILPLFITVYVVVLVFQVTNRFAGKYINDLLIEKYGFSVPGLGLIILLLTVLATGIFVSNFIGSRIFRAAEKFFYKMPIVANVYPSAKKLSDFLFRNESEKKFKKVVLVEYPAPESYSIGFLTNEDVGEFNRKTQKELYTVLVPLSPMPHSGLLLILPREKIIEIDMTINDAIRLVLSGGVIVPDSEKLSEQHDRDKQV